VKIVIFESHKDMQTGLTSYGSSGMLHTLGSTSSMGSLGSGGMLHGNLGSSGVLYIDSGSSSNRGERDESAMYNYMTLGRVHFRSDDAALLVVDLISLAPPSVQQDLIITTMRILQYLCLVNIWLMFGLCYSLNWL
jgi:hypothetical protein